MSYYVDSDKSDFKIKAENIDKAYKAIIDDSDDYKDLFSLKEILIEIGFEPEFDEDTGDIIGIRWYQEKWNDTCEWVFKLIAPFVEENSYIGLVGEEHEHWRYWFKNGTYETISPELVWPNEMNQNENVLTVDTFINKLFLGNGYFKLYENGIIPLCLYRDWLNDIKNKPEILNREIDKIAVTHSYDSAVTIIYLKPEKE